MHEDTGENLSFVEGFGLSNAPLIVTKPVREAEFSVAHLTCRLKSDSPQLVFLPSQDCFFVMLYLDDTRHCDVAPDGRESAVRRYRKGSICLVDLAKGASIRLHDTLHALVFLIPYHLLGEVSEFSKAPGATMLRCLRGEHDEVMWNMGKALLPLFAQHQNQRSCVLGHLAVAVCAHLLHVHGDTSVRGRSLPDLSIWQEKAAKDFMADHFREAVTPDMVAKAVGMSEDSFVRAFEISARKTPDQWLSEYRITQAKRCLSEHEHGFEDVATLCGFRDLAHFTEEFNSITGISPMRWRNRWLN
ncbi:MAG TPA: AraC family transcriptional regulator [Rhizobium sp.]|nr:AraC family transcriptional regulator [Rhizobium sp.]